MNTEQASAVYERIPYLDATEASGADKFSRVEKFHMNAKIVHFSGKLVHSWSKIGTFLVGEP